MHRELMVYMWYPASQQDADFRGPYFPGAKQMDDVSELQHRMREEFGITWSLIVPRSFSHRICSYFVTLNREFVTMPMTVP